MVKNKIEAVRNLLEAQGDKKEEIEATLELIRINEQNEKNDSLRSWIGVITGVLALVVSILVAIFK